MREGARPATRRARAAWSVLAVLCLGLVLATLRSPCGQRSDEDERLVIQRELEARGVAFTRARYMARDFVLIRRLEAALQSDDVIAAARHLVPPRPDGSDGALTPDELEQGLAIADLHTKVPDLDVSDERLSVPGGWLSCDVSGETFRSRTMRWRAHCRGDLPRDATEDYARELVRLRFTPRGLEADGENSAVVAQAEAYRVEMLGPAPAVDVPEALETGYRLLTNARIPTEFAVRAGITAAETEGHSAARLLADAGRFDILRNVLRSRSPSGRVFAAMFLIERAQNSPADDRTIAAIRRLTPRVQGCVGCACGFPIEIAPFLDGAAARRTSYELGLLPAEPRRIIRPGVDDGDAPHPSQ